MRCAAKGVDQELRDGQIAMSAEREGQGTSRIIIGRTVWRAAFCIYEAP